MNQDRHPVWPQACGVKNVLSTEEIEEGDMDKLVRNLLETVSEVYISSIPHALS